VPLVVDMHGLTSLRRCSSEHLGLAREGRCSRLHRAQADFEQWAALDGCQGDPEQVDELCQAFTKCDAGVEVKLCAIAAGHVLYDNRQDFSVPDSVWATFERQTLP